ncbi:DUF5675 family protein [Parapedobacter sp. 10938]|uniref:DUF5675 family protein n=1 Tax=Parapedobacter flavus TaxID=3110225 RepID=UPI002DBE63A1|nr:DUF5675 family protein [Parapedobacter sp. 10938]MEC3881602.1 DUF5675 family protein [Parapedobacter sp. 10938]
MDNAAIKIIRVAEGKQSTLSHLYIDGLFCCYLLEDRIREDKIAGKTCIPPGDYGLSLNHSAGMHAKYAKRFPLLHEGMVEIIEIPNYQLVFFHIGNYHHETRGCPLTGSYWQWLDGDYQVMGSRTAYEFVYPMLMAAIERGNDRLVVENRENRLPHDDWVQAP